MTEHQPSNHPTINRFARTFLFASAGYFLWNKGATLVNAGTLAVMNNALIPAGLVVNLLIWNREADMPRLLIGSGVMFVALYIAERYFRNRALQTAS